MLFFYPFENVEIYFIFNFSFAKFRSKELEDHLEEKIKECKERQKYVSIQNKIVAKKMLKLK